MIETQQRQSDFDEMPTGPYRPSQPSHGLGRLFRRLIGVREEVLDFAPEERPRYTRLGMIVLNTGLMAALSSLVALDSVVNVAWLSVLPVAMLWGFLVVSLDSWMITSTHGVMDAARLRVFVPRLVISVLIGFIIAEPLVLWIFRPAIHAEIRDERRKALDEYESQLRLCNPDDGSAVDTPACADRHLSPTNGSPAATREELTKATAERDTLQTHVDDLVRLWEEKEKFARDECAGTRGPGLSGRTGDGERCIRNRAIADQFRRDNRIDQRQALLDDLNRKVDDLTAETADASRVYADLIAASIATKVEAKRNEQGMIGLLDEERAFGSLTSRSFFVFAAGWLLRLLLIVIDSLPVLAKMLGGMTTYDYLAARQLDLARRLHDKNLSVREQRDNAVWDVRSRRNDHDRQVRMDQVDEAARTARARREEDLDLEIDQLADRLRKQR